jgi:hypothetical protein
MSRKLGNIAAWDKIRALDEELASVNISLQFKGLATGPIISKSPKAPPEHEISLVTSFKTKKRREKLSGEILPKNDAASTEGLHGALLLRHLRDQVSGEKRKSLQLTQTIDCVRA